MNKKELVQVNVIDVLLDDNNTEPITIIDDKGKALEFDQVAVIPLGEDDLYCILKPITKVEGIKDNEAVVFKAIEDGKGSYLEIVKDEDIAIQVFLAYYSLLDDELIPDEKEKILSVIRNDPNLQSVYDDETGELIEYDKMDIYAFRLFHKDLYAIIKETPETDFSEALVWQVVESENGQRLVWVEDEFLESAIINMYLRKHERDGR